MLTISAEINRYVEASQLNFEEQKVSHREKLIMKYAPLVKYISDRLAIRMPSHILKDDLHSAGILGLFDAIDNFDSSRGIKFETYASYRIRGAILDEMRKLDWIPRSVRKDIQTIEAAISAAQVKLDRTPEDEEIAQEMGVNLETYYKMIDRTHNINLLSLDEPTRGTTITAVNKIESDNPSPFDKIKKSELKKVIAGALANLPEKVQMVISLYYFDEMTLKEIAEIMGLTESRISQIHSKAIIILRTKLKAYFEG
ncbi:MAG: FliA/WhiG family RNA polymerase sigma factor [Desulfobacterium sp.]|nr:FliA/WhiG family RNA polymerase sigma factor [Desulfobacterium sp.]MBU3948921.1 FliA/WhiG family RNA polymerase sigma factor [Pseudomonadota bacterium]MBU4010752.1 FliA/WhiG family RNA polymerase sigma factor [Pseudomonadota bacterium]MBU4035949.1 FliA/WhiG family RNA polymerase sigma factor [Pseudomonadota bacterium]